MSNVLAMTEGYNGVVIKTSKMSKYSVADSVLAVECGALLSPLIKKLATVGFCGLESLYGIPGSIGGMIFNNAGAYGSCISDRFIDASIYFPLQKRIAVITKEDMLFSYRASFLKHKEAYVLSARFNLIRKESAAILSDIENIILRRRSSQPYGALSLGSVFKRCGEIAISKLIDELGMRGVSIGGAMVSEKHAGFIVNNGGATSSDFLSLVAYIKNKIYSKYQFVPEEEIEILK